MFGKIREKIDKIRNNPIVVMEGCRNQRRGIWEKMKLAVKMCCWTLLILFLFNVIDRFTDMEIPKIVWIILIFLLLIFNVIWFPFRTFNLTSMILKETRDMLRGTLLTPDERIRGIYWSVFFRIMGESVHFYLGFSLMWILILKYHFIFLFMIFLFNCLVNSLAIIVSLKFQLTKRNDVFFFSIEMFKINLIFFVFFFILIPLVIDLSRLDFEEMVQLLFSFNSLYIGFFILAVIYLIYVVIYDKFAEGISCNYYEIPSH